MDNAEPQKEKVTWKKRARRELTAYGRNVVYLALFFGVFAWYRRWVLASYQITYIHYGVSLVEALILAKVILTGEAIGLGRRFEELPLTFPTLYKTLIFTLFAGFFGILEHMVTGLLHGKGFAGTWLEFKETNRDELLARCLVIFAAFIPFFAFRELERVLGEGRILKLFFQRRDAAHLNRSGGPNDEAPSGAPPS